MAKSIRSKRKRKMRAVKRVRYGAKELEKLKQLVELGRKNELTDSSMVLDTSSALHSSTGMVSSTVIAESASTEKMEIDQRQKYNKKTMKDDKGQYPVWLNKRRIIKLKRKERRMKDAKAKKKKEKSRK